MWKRDSTTTQPGQRGQVWLDRVWPGTSNDHGSAPKADDDVCYIDIHVEHRDATTRSHRLASSTSVSLSDVAPLIGLDLTTEDRERLDEEALQGLRGIRAAQTIRQRKRSIHEEPSREELEQAEKRAQDVLSQRDREKWMFGRENEADEDSASPQHRTNMGRLNDRHGDLLPAQGQHIVVRLTLTPCEAGEADPDVGPMFQSGPKSVHVPALTSGAGGLTFLDALMRFGRSEKLDDAQNKAGSNRRAKRDMKLGGGFSGAFKLPDGHVLGSPPDERPRKLNFGPRTDKFAMGNSKADDQHRGRPRGSGQNVF
ncbi:hypothetical protein CBOM_06481 [Ceraceosorus bombacis]|uniref:Uncharacterized protein n=1 Tax=Ceraceosorus bombacis TaxID=401625 RepID=A0A0P1BJH1_9BASI|nr:hypothetical protein CBOM_06481 [Ceraceosorus bombacis]